MITNVQASLLLDEVLQVSRVNLRDILDSLCHDLVYETKQVVRSERVLK